MKGEPCHDDKEEQHGSDEVSEEDNEEEILLMQITQCQVALGRAPLKMVKDSRCELS